MSRTGSMFLCAALIAALVGCGSNSDSGAGGSGGSTPVGTGGSGTGGGPAGTGGSTTATGTGGNAAGTGGSTPTGTGGSTPTGTGGNTIGGASGAGTGGAVGGAGGSGSVLDLYPRDNTVPGWIVDQTNEKTGGKVAITATTEKATEDLIDGAAADFFAKPYTPVVFSWQNYVNPALVTTPEATTLMLYILEMPTADQATGLFTSLEKANLYDGKTWTEPASPPVGDVSRFTDTGDQWWINFVKGKYYVEVSAGPSFGPAPDYAIGANTTTRDAAYAFANAVAAGIK